jgi:hypothetical protein
VGGSIPNPLSVLHSGGTGTVNYQWYDASTNSAITGAISNTFTPSSYSIPGTYSYYVTINYTGSGCNSVTSNTVQVIVLADPTTTVSNNASYCQNATPTAIVVTPTGGNGTNTYQWFSNTVNSNIGGNPIGSSNSASYTPPVNITGTFYYYCQITQSSANCSVTSAPVQIQVTPAPAITTQPTPTQTVCLDGAPTTLTVDYSNGTGSPTYQWYSNSTNGTTGGTAISGATTNSYTPLTTSTGTTYYYCIINFTSGGCSNVTSNIASVIVNPDPSVSVQPLASQTICIGGTISAPLSFTNTGGTGTPTYQWYLVGSPNQTIGTNSTSYTPGSLSTAGTYNYFAQISYTGSGCASVNTTNATIVVVNDPVVSIASSETYCQNSTSVLPIASTVSGGFGTPSYFWYSNNTNNNTGGTLITTATSNTFTPPVSTIGTTYYYCNIVQSGTNCSSTSPTVSVQVIAQPQITTQPIPTQTVCVGGTLSNLSVSHTNGTSAPTYQWYSNSINDYCGATSISGETNSTYSPPVNSIGTIYYFVKITFESFFKTI